MGEHSPGRDPDHLSMITPSNSMKASLRDRVGASTDDDARREPNCSAGTAEARPAGFSLRGQRSRSPSAVRRHFDWRERVPRGGIRYRARPGNINPPLPDRGWKCEQLVIEASSANLEPPR